MEPAQARENTRASWTAVKLGLKAKTSLMRQLQATLEIEDTQVPEICLQGVGFIGEASTSPFFEDLEVPPTVSQEEYFRGMENRSSENDRTSQVHGKEVLPRSPTCDLAKTRMK